MQIVLDRSSLHRVVLLRSNQIVDDNLQTVRKTRAKIFNSVVSRFLGPVIIYILPNMPATFLQPCDYPWEYNRGWISGWIPESIIEHIRQNRHKYVQQPQVHFVRQTIQSWLLVEANLLQRLTDFAFSNQILVASLSRLSAGKVG